jgi:hypothetical protein
MKLCRAENLNWLSLAYSQDEITVNNLKRILFRYVLPDCLYMCMHAHAYLAKVERGAYCALC